MAWQNSKFSYKYNVAKFLTKYYPNAKEASGGKEAILFCPWHSDDKKKLYINKITGIFNCFVCGVKGNFYKFVQKTLQDRGQVSALSSVISELYDSDTVAAEAYVDILNKNTTINLPDHFYPLYNKGDLGIIGVQALNYLYSRNITDQQIAYYRIGYCLLGSYANRIIIPVYDLDNNLVSFVARDFTGVQNPKVLTPSGYGTEGIKRYVFNLNNVKNTRIYYIGEGVFDAMALGLHGVALFGKIPTETQFNSLVLSKPYKIYCCLDSDAALENEKLAYSLSFHVEEVYLVTLPKGDPSSISKDELLDCINKACKFQSWPSFNF